MDTSEKVFAELNKAEIRYILIGGVPAVLYGVERATFDCDVLIPRNELEISKILAILDMCGYTKIYDAKSNVQIMLLRGSVMITPDFVLKYPGTLRFKNSGLPIDLMIPDKDSILFGLLFEKAIWAKYGSTNVRIIDKDDLILLKSQSNRLKDIDDVKALRSL